MQFAQLEQPFSGRLAEEVEAQRVTTTTEAQAQVAKRCPYRLLLLTPQKVAKKGVPL